MKFIIVSEQSKNLIYGMEELRNKLAGESNREVFCLQYNCGEHRDIIGEIKALHPDLLITTDLAGFEQCTLTDNISYNLLDCKQLHLMFHGKLLNEPYLARQLSIAMFFYCAGDACYDGLICKYPNIPYLKKISGWQESIEPQAQARNAEILYAAVEEVLQECGIQP